MVPEDQDPPKGANRAAYLDMAIKLRDMAAKAHSVEAQQALMQLVVFYEELATYVAAPANPRSWKSKDSDAG